MKKSKSNNKKNIAIIYDVEGWAYHNIAKQIKEHLSKFYNIDIWPVSVFNNDTFRLTLLAEDYDLVHVLWRGLIGTIGLDYFKEQLNSVGISFSEYIEKYYNKVKFTTSVYDHTLLDNNNFIITKNFIKYSYDYTVSSAKLKDIYNNLNLKEPAMEITDGVDLTKFHPQNLERFSNISNRKIVIGWVGNSNFTDSVQDTDVKGLRSIIQPALQELIDEGYPIEMKFADRNVEFLPHDKMPSYYNSIDLYLCASKHEGTPNPVLESMACGVPIISTNVGIVEEALCGEKQKQFILSKRTKDELKEKIIYLLKNPHFFSIISQENLKEIKNWSWEKKCNDFKNFFDICLN